MDGSESRSGLVLELAEEFLERYRDGQRPALKEYTDRYPELAGDILEVFPAMAMMEHIALADESLAGGETGMAPAAAGPARLEQLGDFRIIREVGRGGMGVVYEAEQVSLGRHVALKVLPRQMLNAPKQRHRFEREARAAAKLHHTNIVPVFGVGEHEGTPYYVMQFILGLGLDEVLEELSRLRAEKGKGAEPSLHSGGAPRISRRDVSAADVARSLLTGRFEPEPLDTPKLTPLAATIDQPVIGASVSTLTSGRSSGSIAAGSSSLVLPGKGNGARRAQGKAPTYGQSVGQIGVQVAEALEYAHKQGILHRDVKPSNLLLDTRGTVWVADFGLAKANDQANLTLTGDLLGTLRYMPPEAFEGKSDARGDVYSLGLTLYELLAFRPAFDEKERGRLVKQVTHEAPPRLGTLGAEVPRDLETIVHKAIERDPAHRYATAGELAADLQRFLDDEPIQARRTSVPERAWRWCRRNPVLASLVGTTALLLVAIAVGSIVAAVGIDRARLRADRSAQDERAARRTTEAALTRADRAVEESQRRLIRLYISAGSNASHQDDDFTALLWYQRAWDADRSDPRQEASHRRRLGAMLERCPRLVGLCPHSMPVLSAAFDPTGRRVLTRTHESQAYIWDPFRASQSVPPLRHGGRVLHAGFSPDGASVVTASADHTVRLWDAATGQPIGPALAHPEAVHWATFRPDGRELATACGDGKVRFWEFPAGKLLDRTIACPAPALCVVYHPAGARVLTADRGRNARLWDALTGLALSPPIPHDMVPESFYDHFKRPPAFSRDGRLVLTAGKRTVFLWDSRERIRREHDLGFDINQVELDDAAKRILVVGHSSAAHVLDAAVTGLPIMRRIHHPREVQLGCFHPDGIRLVTSSTLGLIHIWEPTKTQDDLGSFRHFDNATHRLQFSPDARYLLTSSLDGTARVWEIEFRSFVPHEYNFASGFSDPSGTARIAAAARADFTPDGQRAVVVEYSRLARVFRREDPKAVGVPLDLGEPIRIVRFSGDGRRVLLAGMGRARVFEADSGQPVGPPITSEHPFLRPVVPRTGATLPLGSFDLSHDGQRMAVLDTEGTVRVYDVRSGAVRLGPITSPPVPEHRPREPERTDSPSRTLSIASCVLSADGERLAVGSRVGRGSELQLYQINTGKSIDVPCRSGFIQCLDFSADSRRLLVASSDTTVRAWNTDTGAPIGPPLYHRTFARQAAFSPDGQRIAVSVANGTICLWDCVSGDLLVPPFPAGTSARISQIWFSRDGLRVVGQTRPGQGYHWDLPDFRVAHDRAGDLVHLLTARAIDATDGIIRLPLDTFRTDPERFRQAWLAWRSEEPPSSGR